MKFKAIVLSVLMPGMFASAAPSYSVDKVSLESGQIRLQVTMAEKSTDSCPLVPTSIEIIRSLAKEDTGGKLAIKLVVDNRTAKVCDEPKDSKEPHRFADLRFPIGSDLPGLRLGSYALSIDGYEMGYLVYDGKSSVRIVSPLNMK